LEVKILSTYGCAFTTGAIYVEIMPAYKTCYHSRFPNVFIWVICITVVVDAVEKCDIEKNVALKIFYCIQIS